MCLFLFFFLRENNWIFIQSEIGGGWRPNSDVTLDPNNGASLLEGGRGGKACYSSKGIHGFGGYGGGGGGCHTGGIFIITSKQIRTSKKKKWTWENEKDKKKTKQLNGEKKMIKIFHSNWNHIWKILHKKKCIRSLNEFSNSILLTNWIRKL